jgi:hypothetical protein
MVMILNFALWAFAMEGAHHEKAVVNIPDAMVIIPMPPFEERRKSLLQCDGWTEQELTLRNLLRWSRIGLTLTLQACAALPGSLWEQAHR